MVCAHGYRRCLEWISSDIDYSIRKVLHLPILPIVAVTAKAMKGDRSAVRSFGAWDYWTFKTAR